MVDLRRQGQDEAAERVKAPYLARMHEQFQQVLDEGGRLSLPQALRCRVRYFSDGLIFGGRIYVDDAFRSVRRLQVSTFSARFALRTTDLSLARSSDRDHHPFWHG